MSDATVSTPISWRHFSDWIKWLLLGDADELPQFMMRHLKGLIRSYECQVGMLVESLSEFSKKKDDASPDTRIMEILNQFRDEQSSNSQKDFYEYFQKLLSIDAKIVAVMPDEFLVARRWLILDRFRRIAPERAFIEYESSFPPSTDKEKSSEAKNIRADLLNISNYMQQLYVLNIQREKSLASIKWWLLTRTIFLFL